MHCAQPACSTLLLRSLTSSLLRAAGEVGRDVLMACLPPPTLLPPQPAAMAVPPVAPEGWMPAADTRYRCSTPLPKSPLSATRGECETVGTGSGLLVASPSGVGSPAAITPALPHPLLPIGPCAAPAAPTSFCRASRSACSTRPASTSSCTRCRPQSPLSITRASRSFSRFSCSLSAPSRCTASSSLFERWLDAGRTIVCSAGVPH